MLLEPFISCILNPSILRSRFWSCWFHAIRAEAILLAMRNKNQSHS